MARVIDIYQARGRLPFFSGQPTPERAGQASLAMAQFGDAALQFGEQMVVARAQEESNLGTAEFKVRLSDLIQKYQNDPDPSTARERFAQDVQAAVDAVKANMTHPRSRRLFDAQAPGYVATATVQLTRAVAARQVENLQASIAALVDETLIELPNLPAEVRQQRIADVMSRIRLAAPQIGPARAQEMLRQFEVSAAQGVIFDWARRTGPAAAYEQLAGRGPADPEVRALWSRLTPMQQEALRNRVLAEHREQRQVAAANLAIAEAAGRAAARSAVPDFLDAWHRSQTTLDENERARARADAERLLRERLRLDPTLYDRYHGLMYGSQHGARDDPQVVFGIETMIRTDPLTTTPRRTADGREVPGQALDVPALIYENMMAGKITLNTARDLLKAYDARLGEELSRLRDEIRASFSAPDLNTPSSLLSKEKQAQQNMAARAWRDFLAARRANPSLDPSKWWEDYQRRLPPPAVLRDAVQSIDMVGATMRAAGMPLSHDAVRGLYEYLQAQRESVLFHGMSAQEQQAAKNARRPVPPPPRLPPGLRPDAASRFLRVAGVFVNMTPEQFAFVLESAPQPEPQTQRR